MSRCDAIELSIPSDPGYLAIVRAVIEKVAVLAGFDDGQVDRIILAVDEACTNIIRHQYDGRKEERIDIEARFNCEARTVEFVLRDYGPVRDASLFCGRSMEDVRPGGLGLHIIRDTMDEVQYSAAPDGGMQLRLTKSATAKCK